MSEIAEVEVPGVPEIQDSEPEAIQIPQVEEIKTEQVNAEIVSNQEEQSIPDGVAKFKGKKK